MSLIAIQTFAAAPCSDWYNYRFYFNHPDVLPTPPSIKLIDPIAGTTANYTVAENLDL